jgi:hypothetical protein
MARISQRLSERARRAAHGKGLRYLGTEQSRMRCWLAGYRAAERDTAAEIGRT